MKLKDAPVIELIEACAKQQRDTYFALSSPPSLSDAAALAEGLAARVLMLLPGTVYPGGDPSVTVLNSPADLFLHIKSKITLADIRLTGYDELSIRAVEALFE